MPINVKPLSLLRIFYGIMDHDFGLDFLLRLMPVFVYKCMYKTMTKKSATGPKKDSVQNGGKMYKLPDCLKYLSYKRRGGCLTCLPYKG